MLVGVFVVLPLLAAAPTATCVDKCGSTGSTCAQRCGTQTPCLERCDQHQTRCMSGCVAADDQAHAAALAKRRKLPCGGSTATRLVAPCSDDEEARLRDSLKTARGLCKDKEGNLTPCPGEAERAEQLRQKYAPPLDCKDAEGAPAVCPKTKAQAR